MSIPDALHGSEWLVSDQRWPPQTSWWTHSPLLRSSDSCKTMIMTFPHQHKATIMIALVATACFRWSKDINGFTKCKQNTWDTRLGDVAWLLAHSFGGCGLGLLGLLLWERGGSARHWPFLGHLGPHLRQDWLLWGSWPLFVGIPAGTSLLLTQDWARSYHWDVWSWVFSALEGTWGWPEFPESFSGSGGHCFGFLPLLSSMFHDTHTGTEKHLLCH